jgi:hypothetical protein
VLFDEELLTFTEAAKSLPAVNGSRLHPATIWRWSTKGVRGIRLETRKLGGRSLTSKEALERFTTALAEAGPITRENHTSPRPRSPERRLKEIATAEAELASAGL